MSVFIVGFFTAFLYALPIVRSTHIDASVTGDHVLSGVQKLHASAVPRIGGLATAVGSLGTG